MRRTAWLTLAGVVSALFALVAPVSVATAAAGDHFAPVTDAAGDVATSRGDLVRTTLHYGEYYVTLRAELRNADSYQSANWQHGDTMLAFAIDTDSDAYDDYAALVYNTGHDTLTGPIVNTDYRSVECRRRPSQRGDVFTLRFPHKCLLSPLKVRFQAIMWYDRDAGGSSRQAVTRDAAPNKLGWSRWAARPPQPSRVVYTTRPAASVTYGSQVQIRAAFPSDWEGRRLHLYRRFKGTTRWVRIATASDEYDDAYFPPVTLYRPADFQVRFAGNHLWKPSATRVATTSVTMVIQQDTPPQTLPLDERVRVTGRVRPANPGGSVSLQQRVDGRWVRIASTKLTAESTYSLGTTPARSRRYTYRVHTAGDGVRAAANTKPFIVDVYDARIRTVEPSDPVRETQDLNSEFISVINAGRVNVNLAQWLVTANVVDGARVPYHWNEAILQPGDGIRIHTGSGDASAGHLYLGLNAPLWPDAGLARIYNPDDILIDELQYGPD